MANHGCTGPTGRTGYPTVEDFFQDEPRARWDRPGGPANDTPVIFEARDRTVPDDQWHAVHNLETGQVWAWRQKTNGTWSNHRYIGGITVDGPVRVLGHAPTAADLATCLDTAAHGDPINFLTGRVGGLDWIAKRLAGSTATPPP